MAIAGLCFDLDNTLYPVSWLRVMWRLRHRRGLLVAMLSVQEKLRREPPKAGRAAFVAREAELLAPFFGWSLAEAEAELQSLQAELPAALTEGESPFPGLVPALWRVAAAGMPIAVLSDYAPGDKLSRLGLADLPWASVLGACEIGALKPSPIPFLKTAEAMGLLPEQLLVIGDREDLDVRGARAAGMPVWRFGPHGGKSAADRVLKAYTPDVFDALT